MTIWQEILFAPNYGGLCFVKAMISCRYIMIDLWQQFHFFSFISHPYSTTSLSCTDTDRQMIHLATFKYLLYPISLPNYHIWHLKKRTTLDDVQIYFSRMLHGYPLKIILPWISDLFIVILFSLHYSIYSLIYLSLDRLFRHVKAIKKVRPHKQDDKNITLINTRQEPINYQ